jgi:hypothetical protein
LTGLRGNIHPDDTRLLRSNTRGTEDSARRFRDAAKAEGLIESCEHCNQDGAEIPFDNILDRVTGSDPRVTDYLLSEPAKCPFCRREILEKTLVELK